MSHFSRQKQKLLAAGMALFSLSILFIIVYRQKDFLLQYNWDIHWENILFSYIFYSLALVVVVRVWVWIFQGFSRDVRFPRHFYNYCISNIARRLPGTIWYVFLRGKLYQENGISMGAVTLASGVELAVSIISGALVAVLFAADILVRFEFGIWSLVILILVSLMLLNPWVLKWLMVRLGKGANISDFSYPRIILFIISFSFVWIFGGIQFFFLIRAVYPLEWSQIYFVISSWALVGILSYALLFLPSNVGFSELSLSLLLASILPSFMAVFVAVFNRILSILFEVVWALIVMGAEVLDRRKAPRLTGQ
jgi:glycosyltransferase 2 family protein